MTVDVVDSHVWLAGGPGAVQRCTTAASPPHAGCYTGRGQGRYVVALNSAPSTLLGKHTQRDIQASIVRLIVGV